MELDNLKKSWQVLDEHLKQHSMTDEQKITELIASCKNSIKQGVGHLMGMQRRSLIFGALFFIAIIIVSLCLLVGTDNIALRQRLYALMSFSLFILVAGGMWDWYTYKKISQIRVEQMSVLEVSQRMITIRKLACYEVVAVCFLIPLATAILYCILGYQHYPIHTQLVIIAVTLVADFFILYYIYKKLLYRQLNSIRNDINELKDLCTE